MDSGHIYCVLVYWTLDKSFFFLGLSLIIWKMEELDEIQFLSTLVLGEIPFSSGFRLLFSLLSYPCRPSALCVP